MCRFCVEHGEGERWYLQAKNYAYDLQSDLARREYVVDFVAGFSDMREGAIGWMERLERVPVPLSTLGKSLVSRRQQKIHFGQPVPIEECESIFGLATSITAIPCVCRMHEPGKSADAVCLLVTTQPVESVLMEGFADYADGPGLEDFNRLTADQAMGVLRECESNGLMHSVWTFLTPFTAAICNCNLESGCMAMKLTVRYGMKVMWRGEWAARLDAERCTRCLRCAGQCPFGAISATRSRVDLDVRRCWGCGVCRSTCSQGAISLVDRRSVPEVSSVW